MAAKIGIWLVAIVMMCGLKGGISKRIILNEDKIIDSCTSTCSEMPTLYDKHGCTKFSDCKRSSKGWTRGFVRCDYCDCNCDTKAPPPNLVFERKKVSITEPDLYGTCTTTCPRSGLVRTNFKNCQEVRDCYKQRNGWTRGFVRCDYCTCTCVNRKYVNSYVLKNVVYDMGRANIHTTTPRIIASTTVTNKGDIERTPAGSVSFSTSKSTSVTTSKSITAGITVTVTGGVSKGVVSKSVSVAASLSTTFTQTSGKTKTTTVTHSKTAPVRCPPRSTVKMLIVAREQKADIPYTATLVTKYKDGSTKSERITGMYRNMKTVSYNVDYDASVPIGFTKVQGDCSGHNLQHIYNLKSPQECAKKCLQNGRCKEFFFSDLVEARSVCILEHSVCPSGSMMSTDDSRYQTYVMTKHITEPSGYTKHRGDCGGNDINCKTSSSEDLLGCAERCSNLIQCKGFFFSSTYYSDSRNLCCIKTKCSSFTRTSDRRYTSYVKKQ